MSLDLDTNIRRCCQPDPGLLAGQGISLGRAGPFWCRMKPINPPALVQAAVELEQLAFEIKGEMELGDRLTSQGIERYRMAGVALLKAKSQCPHGSWMEWLQQNEIPSQRASECMRIASEIEGGQYSRFGGNLKDALEVVTTERDSTTPEICGDKAIPPVNLMCRDCRVRFGKPQPSCKDCARLRAQSRRRKCCDTPSGSGDHLITCHQNPDYEREPGDDTEAEESAKKSPKNGAEMFSLRAFRDGLGKATAELDKLAREAGLTKPNPQGTSSVITTPTHRGLERMMSEAYELMEKIGSEAEKWKNELRKRGEK